MSKTLEQYKTALRATTMLALEIMAKHGLTEQGWTFEYDRAKRRAGCCKHSKKKITLSIYFVTRNTDDEIKDCLLHETAHAIAGHAAGHGPAWRAVCRKIGAKPKRCYDSEKVNMPAGRYKAVCGRCSQEFHRHRMPKQGSWRYCSRCGPVDGKLVFS